MGPNAHRWTTLLRPVLADHPELMEAVEGEDVDAILHLLQRYGDEAKRRLDDFRQGHPDLAARLKRARPFDDSDAEVDWYSDEEHRLTQEVGRWGRLTEDARDTAGL